jgi:hypothetical protein
VVSGIKGQRATPLSTTDGSLVYLHFRTLEPGVSALDVTGLEMTDLNGNKIDYQFEPGRIAVK